MASVPPEAPKRTIGDAITYWKEHRTPLKRSGDDDESIFRSIEPFFGSRLLEDAAGIVMDVDRYRSSKLHLHSKTVANLGLSEEDIVMEWSR